MKRSYTVILVPHAGARYRKIPLASWMVKTLLGAAILGILTASLLTVYYVKFYRDVRELRQLRLANEQLTREKLDLMVNVEHMNRHFASMADFNRKLSVMAGLGDELENELDGGVGGPHDVDFTASPTTYEHAIDDLGRLRSELTALEEKSRVLERFYEENTLMLASTPSIWPVRGYLSSSFGARKDPFTGDREMHYGLDISTPSGRPVVATADGIVLYAAPRGTYGNVVVIDHKFGRMTRYAHLSKFNVRAGKRVERGDVIGFVGSTGRSRAPHLHYEVWVDDRPTHPLNYVLEYYRSFDPRNRPLSSTTAP